METEEGRREWTVEGRVVGVLLWGITPLTRSLQDKEATTLDMVPI